LDTITAVASPLDPAALEALVTAFERGQLTPDTFHHREHLLVALALVSRYPREEALARMRVGLRAILERAGAHDAYHETVTQCWLHVLRHRLGALDQTRPLIDRWADALAWSEAHRPLETHYSADRLASPEARRDFVPPDRAPLPDNPFDTRGGREAR
jgi:hypothetical protein